MCLQSNHRSWADFYLDVVATDGNAQMLSRMAVALAFPMFMGAVSVIRSVVLFKRNVKHDKKARARALVVSCVCDAATVLCSTTCVAAWWRRGLLHRVACWLMQHASASVAQPGF